MHDMQTFACWYKLHIFIFQWHTNGS